MFELAFSFALGALSVALLALAAIPALARRANRLAAARARLFAPLDEKAALAERDALRASHAIDISRQERIIAQAAEREGVARAELGRESARLAALEKIREALLDDVGAQRDEIAQMAQSLAAAAVELGAAQVAMRDLSAQREGAEALWTDARRRMIALEAGADRDRAHRAALETQAEGLRMQIEDARGAHARTAGALARREEEMAALAQRHALAMQKGSMLVQALDAQTLDAQRAHARIDDLMGQLARAGAAQEEALSQAANRLGEIAERDLALKAMAARHLEFQIAARAREQELSQAAQDAAAARAAAEGALGVSRQNVAALRNQFAKTAGGPDDGHLREAIARVGAQVERLARVPAARKPRGAAAFRPKIAPGGRRDDPAPPLGARGYAEEAHGPEV